MPHIIQTNILTNTHENNVNTNNIDHTNNAYNLIQSTQSNTTTTNNNHNSANIWHDNENIENQPQSTNMTITPGIRPISSFCSDIFNLSVSGFPEFLHSIVNMYIRRSYSMKLYYILV